MLACSTGQVSTEDAQCPRPKSIKAQGQCWAGGGEHPPQGLVRAELRDRPAKLFWGRYLVKTDTAENQPKRNGMERHVKAHSPSSISQPVGTAQETQGIFCFGPPEVSKTRRNTDQSQKKGVKKEYFKFKMNQAYKKEKK